jgi:diguanylate cyclase (GGDEF)-like protein
VNDQFGHEAGDRVLIQFARILKSSVREDDVVIRVGGEEFLVILKKTAAPYLVVYAEKIRMQVEKTTFTVAADEKQKIHKTCSVGYVAFPFVDAQPDLFSLEKSIMLADLGLYQAKAKGRNLSVKLFSRGQIPADAEIDKMVTSLDFASEKGYIALSILPENRAT